MGTNATTRFQLEGVDLVSLYTQCDGYLASWGRKLKETLLSYNIVDGIQHRYRGGRIPKEANGVLDLYLSAITEMKTEAGIGYMYLQEPGYDGHEYNYLVNSAGNSGPLSLTVNLCGAPVYAGLLSSFDPTVDV